MSNRLNQIVAEELLDGFQYNYAYDVSSNLEYIGKAKPGTGDADAGWAIAKFTYSGTNMTTKRLASNNSLMDKVWNDRATYF